MIQITYQLRSESAPRILMLTREEYFDPLAENETFERHAIPRFHHAYQYTAYSAEELKWTVLRGGPVDGSVVRTQFLDGERSRMTHRIDADGYEELIHSTAIGEDGFLIVRTMKNAGQAWSVVMSTHLVNDSVEEDKHTGWTREEMLEFCGIGN